MERLGADEPEQIGPYTLLGRLGSGGAGTDYVGRSASGLIVSVKLIRPDPAEDSGFRQRLRDEVAAARGLPDTFVARVVDADVEGPVPWVASTLIPGLSLRQAVGTQQHLPESTLRVLAEGLAGALAAVHEAGVAHGSLQPDNVVVAESGPYVVGLGVPRLLEPLLSEGATRASVGLAGYIAPEQVSGQAGTAAGDMFSLGATLVFAASGRDPLGPGSGFNVAALPPSLREVVAGCLYDESQARPTARQLLDYLGRQGVPPVPANAWLPLPLAQEVAAANRQWASPAAFTGGSTALVPGTGRGGISRRTLIIGLAGGAVAVGGVAAAVAGLSGGSPTSAPTAKGGSAPTSTSPGGSPKASGPATVSPSVSSSPSSSEPPRIELAAPEAVPAWSVVVEAKPTAVVASDKVIVLLSEKATTFLDSAGKSTYSPLPVGQFSSSYNSLATFADGVLYILGDTGSKSGYQLGAVDGGTGKSKWVVNGNDTEGDIRNDPSYVAVSGSVVYVCGIKSSGMDSLASGYIWAFDMSTGRNLWRTTGTDIANVLIPPSGRYLLAGAPTEVDGRNNQVQMIDAQNQGARGWKMPVPHALYQQGRPMTAFAGGLFIFGDEQILAVDPATGKEAWHLSGGPEQPDVRFGFPTPSLDGKTVYIPVGEDLVATNTADGSVKWIAHLPPLTNFKASLAFSGVSADLQCSSDTVFATDVKGTLWAIDAATGRARWTYSDPGQPAVGFLWTVGGDHVYISSNLTVTAIPAHKP
ncbi:PQQ-binding-like beta-propeller repeat protein [Kitasatospora sp. NBC_00240]|nr:PQQ-binding-like beta-propeller repeat protein [Kitasatospora sp. NBC_00240]